jgi:hypothetical protein
MQAATGEQSIVDRIRSHDTAVFWPQAAGRKQFD